MNIMRRGTYVGLIGVLTLAACGGGGSSTPTTDNPASSLVTVEFASASLAGVTVTLSTGLNNQTPTGVIATAATNSAGQVTFSLPATGTLCVSATEAINSGTAFAGNCLSQPFPTSISLSLNS
jgi:hypothetical protein